MFDNQVRWTIWRLRVLFFFFHDSLWWQSVYILMYWWTTFHKIDNLLTNGNVKVKQGQRHFEGHVFVIIFKNNNLSFNIVYGFRDQCHLIITLLFQYFNENSWNIVCGLRVQCRVKMSRFLLCSWSIKSHIFVVF